MIENTTFEKVLFKFRYLPINDGDVDDVTICFPLTDDVYFNLKDGGSIKDLLNDLADSFEINYNCRIIEWSSNFKWGAMEWELMFPHEDNRSLEERRNVLSELMRECYNLIERMWKLKAMM